MSKTKAQEPVSEQTTSQPTRQQQPETSQKRAVPTRTSAASASAMPPANGSPPAARAADMLSSSADGPDTLRRARMMSHMQRSVGNARVSRLVQRQPTAYDTPNVTPETAAYLDASQGGGRALPNSVRESAEVHLERDLSAVRVHDEPAANAAAASLGARAFTHGADIYLARGESASDRELMTHELTHVAQQNAGVEQADAPPTIQRYSLDEFASDVSGAASSVYEAGSEVVQTGVEFVEEGGEAIAEAGRALVDRLAPGLIDFLRNPGARIFDALCIGVDAFVASVIGTLQRIDFVSELEAAFASASNHVSGVISGLRSGMSDALGAILGPFVQAIEDYGLPLLRGIQGAIETVQGVIASIWEMIGRPVVDFLGEAGGAAWDAIVSMAEWVWDLTEPVRSAVGDAWEWVKEQFGIAWQNTEGIRSWIIDQAESVWESLKETLKPVMGPLKVIGGILLVLSPLGPIVMLTQVIMPLWHKLRWIWENWNTDDILVWARDILRTQILPPIIDGVGAVSQAIATAAGWLVNITTQISTQFAALLGAIGVTACLRSVNHVMTYVVNQFTRLANWAATDFAGLMDLVRAGLDRLVAFLRPILEFLIRLATVALNPFTLPLVLAGILWQIIPNKLKPPIITFLLELLITFIQPLPLFATMGPLGALMKDAVLGFLRRLRGMGDEEKIYASNRIAELLTGSMQFLAGFMWGLLRGIWEGLTDPFVMLYLLVQVAVKLTRFLAERGQALAGAVFGAGRSEKPAAAPQAVSPAAPSNAASAEVEQAANDVASAEGEWQSGQTQASSRENANEQGLFDLLSSAWESLASAAGRLGGNMADALMRFIRQPDFELGNQIGWGTGMIVFEVVLAVLTAGVSEALRAGRAVSPVLRAIIRFLDLGGEILSGLFKMIGRIRGPVMYILGPVGRFLGKIPGLRAVWDKIARAFRAIFRYGDEAADTARRSVGEAVEESAEAASERAARETMEEAGQRTGREATEEAGERAGREAAEESGARGGREAAEKAAEHQQATVAARALETAMDRANAPVAALIALLTGLKRQYRWIDRFEARPTGVPGRYDIWMIASRVYIDEYTENDDLAGRETAELPEGTHLTFEPSMERSEVSDWVERWQSTPRGGHRGEWVKVNDGTRRNGRGNGLFIPSDPHIAKLLREYEMDGVPMDGVRYINSYPDFAPLAKDTVVLDVDLTHSRDINYPRIHEAFAEKWNLDGRPGGPWTPDRVKQELKRLRLTPHEVEDSRTVHLVDSEIHDFFNHMGGVAEQSRRRGLRQSDRSWLTSDEWNALE